VFRAYTLADVRQRPLALPARIRSTTPELVTRLVKLRDPHLQPTERLRWRSLTAPRRPNLDQADVQQRQDAMPSALWIDWTIRLCPPTGLHVDTFRTVAGAALLVPGATAPVETLFAGHGARDLAKTFSHVVQFLPPPPADAAILRALTQLAESVDRHRTPIDYARRRHLAAAEPLIDRTQWDTICEEAGVPTGGQAKLTNAQRWIWETLTGGLLSDAPGGLELVDHSILGFHLFALHLPTVAAAALDNHAARLLEQHGIDEPLTWSPPLEWAEPTETPGVDPDSIDPDSIDPDTVHSMLRGGFPVGKIADQLGTSIVHVRWIVRRHPPQLRALSKANEVLRGARPADITPERLNQLVNVEGRTLRDIAREVGMHRRRLAELLRHGGYPVPPSQRRSKYKPEPEWLREQYLDGRRTLPDIAAELGTTAANVARFAKEYKIPLRPRGGASHASAVNHRTELPHPLAAALAGQGGYQRVQRFQTMTNSTSIGEAAKTLEIDPCTISTQLTKLERAAGGVLLRRRQSGGVRLELTPLGQVLVDQANAHLNDLAHTQTSHQRALARK
jgi:DNA-binding MarR family transcriptional regulator